MERQGKEEDRDAGAKGVHQSRFNSRAIVLVHGSKNLELGINRSNFQSTQGTKQMNRSRFLKFFILKQILTSRLFFFL